MKEDKIRVLIADDHQMVRQGLRTFLGLHDDIDIVGEAADGIEAVEMARRFKPDIVLMDLIMPRLDGISATREIISSGLGTKVITLTSFTGNDNVFPALEAGASSYMLKDISPANLVEAVRATYRGETRLHPEVAKKLVEKVSRSTRSAEQIENLSDREMDVVCLVAKGKSNHEIGAELGISEKTVKTHVSNILGKLDLSDRTQLAIYALNQGLTGKK